MQTINLDLFYTLTEKWFHAIDYPEQDNDNMKPFYRKVKCTLHQSELLSGMQLWIIHKYFSIIYFAEIITFKCYLFWNKGS